MEERFCDEIRAIRESTGLSQAKFASRFEIPKRTYESWEMGEKEPPIYVANLIKKVARMREEIMNIEFLNEIGRKLGNVAKSDHGLKTKMEQTITYMDQSGTVDKVIEICLIYCLDLRDEVSELIRINTYEKEDIKVKALQYLFLAYADSLSKQ